MGDNREIATDSYGRVIIVDPNQIMTVSQTGHVGAMDGASMPLEQLNINVELTATRKNRTILLLDASSHRAVLDSTDDTGTLKVNFFQGSELGYGNNKGDVNKMHSLTTNYTDIDYKLSKEGSNTEALGITNIQIDFNTALAPMVRIDFIDIRGGSLFSAGMKSKYRVFFELPYPIFNLTVKGYYGHEVSYCLHLLKFTSKFNTRTGNFEIGCDFIGYTYAFLTDMIIGYLRGITYTAEGQKEFDRLVAQIASTGRPTNHLIYLNKFREKVNDINKGIEALSSTSDAAGKFKSATAALISVEQIAKIQLETMNSLCGIVGIGNYKYDLSTLTLVMETPTQLMQDKFDFETNSYDSAVIGYIAEANKQAINAGSASVLSDSFFKFAGQIDNTNEDINYSIMPDSETKTDIANLLPTNKDNIMYFNLNKSRKLLSLFKQNLIKAEDDARIALATEIKNVVVGKIGFEPTIKNVIELFTVHCETLMNRICDVGSRARTNPTRRNVLKSHMQSFDYNYKTPENGSQEFYPFPKYSVVNASDSAQETWLGDIPNSDEIDEVRFVNDLIGGILKSAKLDNQINTPPDATSFGWFPVNPLDTPLVNSINPYNFASHKEFEKTNFEIEVAKVIGERAFTFLDFSNKNITPNELAGMAKLEAVNVYKSLSKDKFDKFHSAYSTSASIISALLTQPEYNASIKGRHTFMIDTNPDYVYSLISDELTVGYDKRQVIPIRSHYVTITNPILYSFNGNIFHTTGGTQVMELPGTLDAIKGNSITIGNCILPLGTALTKNDNDLKEDGTIYVKIIRKEDIDKRVGKYIYETSHWQRISNQYKLNTNVNDRHILKFDVIADNYIGKGAGDSFETDWEIVGPGEFYTQEIRGFKYETPNESGSTVAQFYSNSFHKPTEPNIGILITGEITNFRGKIIEYIKKSNKSLKDAFSSELFIFIGPSTAGKISIPLFSSNLFTTQDTWAAKSFIFLNSLPFQGMVNTTSKTNGLFKGDKGLSPIGFFSERAGIIAAPYAWVLFVGGLFWRIREYESKNLTNGQKLANNSPIKLTYIRGGKHYLLDTILFNDETEIKDIDAFNEFFNSYGYLNYGYGLAPLSFLTNTSNFSKQWIDRELNNLPNQVKNEFIAMFLEFAEGDFRYKYYPAFVASPPSYNDNVRTLLADFVSETRYIINGTWRIWNQTGRNNTKLDRFPATNPYRNKELFKVNKTTFKTYLDTFYVELDYLIKNDAKGNDNLSFTNAIDDKMLKLNVYRNIKAIYDKWISGTDCKQQTVWSSCNSTLKSDNHLIDTFKFIDRAYNEIGDKLIINPASVVSQMTGNYNQSFYDLLGKILSGCYMDFIPLPAFIDFKQVDQLKEMFTPYSYNRKDERAAIEPSFVCVYLGQRSQHLNYEDSNFKPDGITFGVKSDETTTGVPTDFLDEDKTNLKARVPIFVVNYASQNQSIFKDVTLDQQEFSESDEGLQIIDDLANGTTQVNRTYMSQNLFNLYSVRSYSCEVECLGNVMIQPMMYFQLNNIPLFRGAYWIINTSHTITPNHMTTKFKGVRIRHDKTPLLTDYSVFYNYIGMLDSNAVTTFVNTGMGSRVGVGGYPQVTVAANYATLSNDERFELYSKFNALYEGGYTDNPADYGNYWKGKKANALLGTNKGVTSTTYWTYMNTIDPTNWPTTRIPTVDEMKNDITEAVSKAVMKTLFWDKAKGGEITNQSIATLVVDIIWGVGNTGEVKSVLRELDPNFISAGLNIDDVTVKRINSMDAKTLFTALYNRRAANINTNSDDRFKKGLFNRLNSIPVPA